MNDPVNPVNNPAEHPLVRAHLDAVDRCTAPLPAERRHELLADLREHIETALAEHDPADEDAVRHVLAQLGDPRRIADAALAEDGRPRPEPETARRTTLTLLLAVLPLPLLLVPAIGPVLALVTAVAAAVRVAKSAQWTRREKTQATLLLLSPLLLTPLAAGVVAVSSSHGLSPAGVLVACAVGFCPTPVAALRLSRSATRLRTAATLTA
ncbi:HAAS signaling domain-containing protein [Kitasatospora sp. NPDC090091]|uniref:HAAS signaling domain-containing protein n=1 Tax=Kitasatospora sp. NPDC090091 TaxID=3364081 RepID=UPI00380E7358